MKTKIHNTILNILRWLQIIHSSLRELEKYQDLQSKQASTLEQWPDYICNEMKLSKQNHEDLITNVY